MNVETIITQTEKTVRKPEKERPPGRRPESPALIDLDNLEEFRPVPVFFN